MAGNGYIKCCALVTRIKFTLIRKKGKTMSVKEIISEVSQSNLSRIIFTLCRDPLPFRTVLYHIPWHEKNTLEETDDFIIGELRALGIQVNVIPVKVRPFRCNPTHPLHHWYDAPKDDDPWFDAANIEAVIPGTEKPEEIIQLVSHKDSPSWINSPGAYDNAVGVATNLEILRVLASRPLKRTVRVLFCNEEHTPWHSLTYATDAKKRGDDIIATLNNDSISGGLTEEERARGIKRATEIYSTPEGKRLAEFVASRSDAYQLPLETFVAQKEIVNDDDGSFIKAGYPCSVMDIGSWPYCDKEYHLAGDVPERVDMENLALSVKLVFAAVCDIADGGRAVFVE